MPPQILGLPKPALQYETRFATLAGQRRITIDYVKNMVRVVADVIHLKHDLWVEFALYTQVPGRVTRNPELWIESGLRLLQ